MKSSATLAASVLAGAALLLFVAPAMARQDVQWSVTVGSDGYYAPPAVAYAPPPVVYVQPQPRVVYVQPRPYYQPGVTVIEYGGRHEYRERDWRGHHGHRHWDRDDRREFRHRDDRGDRDEYRY